MSISKSENNNMFATSQTKTLNYLVDCGVFTLVPKSGADGHRIYNSRFMDKIKPEGTLSAFEASRLFIIAYNDKEHSLLTVFAKVKRALK